MSTQVHDTPGNFQSTYALRAHAAATATEVANVFRAPYACKIVSVELIPDGAVTGQATNYTSLAVLNAGTAGTGTTVLGTAIDYSSAGVTQAAGVAVDLYRPATPLAVASGVILQVQMAKTGTGLALPGGLVVTTYQGN